MLRNAQVYKGVLVARLCFCLLLHARRVAVSGSLLAPRPGVAPRASLRTYRPQISTDRHGNVL